MAMGCCIFVFVWYSEVISSDMDVFFREVVFERGGAMIYDFSDIQVNSVVRATLNIVVMGCAAADLPFLTSNFEPLLRISNLRRDFPTITFLWIFNISQHRV